MKKISKLFKLPLGKFDFRKYVNSLLAVIVVIFLIINQMMITTLGKHMTMNNNGINLVGDINQNIANIVTFKSPFYSQELGLDFSNIQAINISIKKLAVMAPFQGSRPLNLSPEDLKRYVKIGTQPYMTCEFCCGVKTLVRKDGTPTCGCAHSIAMRGTVAYLLQNYPNMTDDEISHELSKQKALYFPKQMGKRLGEQLSAGEYSNDIKYLIYNLTEDQIASMEKEAKVSGIQPNIQSPDMVGGC